MDEEKKLIPLATLDDLKPTNIMVEIELVDGSMVAVPMRTLTYFEFNQVARDLPDPSPDVVGVDPSTRRPLYNHNEPAYLTKVQAVQEERAYRRLAKAIQMDFPDCETLEQRAAWIRENLDNRIIKRLGDVLAQAAAGGEARIISRAETFQRDGTGAEPGVPGDGLDAGTVGQSAGRGKSRVAGG